MPEIRQPEGAAQPTINLRDNKTIIERCHERFEPWDYVRVINPDDEKIEWDWMPSNAELETFTDNGAVRVINGRRTFADGYSKIMPGNERHWALDAGQEDVMLGENAYILIDALAKRMITKRVIAKTPDQKETIARNFNYSDGALQEEMIDRIYIGVERPNFSEPEKPAPTPAKKA